MLSIILSLSSLLPRGGASTSPTSPQETEQQEELSLDEKVKAAMKKLGLSPPDLGEEDNDEEGD